MTDFFFVMFFCLFFFFWLRFEGGLALRGGEEEGQNSFFVTAGWVS